MRPTIRIALGVAIAVSAGCFTYTPIPIPVVGARADVDSLAGEWQGTYRSVETGRSGTISFSLATGRDTAYGEVIMIPSRYSAAVEPADPRVGELRNLPQLLKITFVGTSDRKVRGTLDVYLDPDCQCPMRTTFTGAFTRPGKLEGTFESQTWELPTLVRGEWSANRIERRVVERR